MFFEGVLCVKRISHRLWESVRLCCSRLAESVKSYCRRVFTLADSPHKIAAGAALGLAFDFLPVPLISIPLAYAAAKIARLNTVAAVATVVFFKLFVPFFFTLNVVVGSAVFGGLPWPQPPSAAGLPLGGFLSVLTQYGFPFLAGSVFNAVLAGAAVYFSLLALIKRKCGRFGA